MFIDICITFFDFCKDVIKFFSIIFTVITDITNKNSQIIKFDKRNDYEGFIVVSADTVFNKRALSWFYRNYSIPDIDNWNNFIKLFNLKQIPPHYIMMFKNNSIDVDVIYIQSITNDCIFYSVNNNFIKIPITIGTLFPEEYINNYEAEINKKK